MAVYPLYDEQQLFERIARGDEEAFGHIFHTYNAKLFPFVIKVTRSESAAQEIIQETFLRLWVHRESLAQMEQPVSWLYKVASNLSLSYLRRQAAEIRRIQQVSMSSTVAENNGVNNIAVREMQSLLNAAIDRLPPRRQLIYKLSRQQGLSHKEIAEQLHLSRNTVKNQVVVALKFIQDYILRVSGMAVFLFAFLFIR